MSDITNDPSCVACGSRGRGFRYERCVKCYSKNRYDNDPEYRAKCAKNGAAWHKKKRAEDPGYFREKGKVSARRIGTRYTASVSLAKKRGHTFSLTKDEYFLLISRPCFYCSGPLPETSVGLDRVNNSRGYNIDNVVPCCKECNRLKGNVYSLEETQVMVRALKEYHDGKRSK